MDLPRKSRQNSGNRVLGTDFTPDSKDFPPPLIIRHFNYFPILIFQEKIRRKISPGRLIHPPKPPVETAPGLYF